ncbi:MAG: PAS domain S-box protein, partial [Candidatus Zixiibacteriota bacterium]
MEPNTRNSAGYSKPIPSYQNSGTLVQNKIWKRVREWKSQLIVSGVVVIFAVLSLLNETLDLPHLLANAPRTPVNWAEIALDVIALFLVGFISIFLLSLVESRRRRAEEVLRENQKKHRAIFNAARDGIVLIESETGQIVDCNPEFENLTGRRLENLKEMKIWEVRPTEKVEKTKKKFFEIKVNGSGGSAELELEKPDGKIVHVEFLSKALRIRGKQYIQNVVRDITERKRAEEALQSEKGRLQALMEGLARTGIGIDVVGTDYKVVFQNQTLRERFGDLTGKLCYENYMGLKRPCDFCPMLKAIRNNKVESVELKAADGTNYELISAPFPNPDGTVDKVIEVVMDITERKKAEDAL